MHITYTGVSYTVVFSGSDSGLEVGESRGFSAMGVIFPLIPASSAAFLTSEIRCDMLLLALTLRLVTVLEEVVLIMLLRFEENPDTSVSTEDAERRFARRSTNVPERRGLEGE